MCANWLAHLDDGVLSFGYHGLFPNVSRPSVAQFALPLATKQNSR